MSSIETDCELTLTGAHQHGHRFVAGSNHLIQVEKGLIALVSRAFAFHPLDPTAMNFLPRYLSALPVVVVVLRSTYIEYVPGAHQPRVSMTANRKLTDFFKPYVQDQGKRNASDFQIKISPFPRVDLLKSQLIHSASQIQGRRYHRKHHGVVTDTRKTRQRDHRRFRHQRSLSSNQVPKAHQDCLASRRQRAAL